MKIQRQILTIILALGGVALAQMQPGAGQPGGIGQAPGQHIPGVGEPGLGGNDQPPVGQGQQQTTQSNTPKVDDDTLMRQVHEQLARSNQFNDVKISVKDGVVTLEGSVPQKQDRKQAKQLAESVPGVRKVREKLSVRPSGASAGAGANTVGGTSGAATQSTNPETSNNNAGSISGNASAASGTQAGTASMGQSGSTSTAPSTNPGTTPGSNAGAPPAAAPVGTTLPDNTSLQGQLQTAFRNDPSLGKDSISANVTDKTVELTGTVGSGKERQTAKALAESFAGNRKVVDRITVSPAELPSSSSGAAPMNDTGTASGSATGIGNSTTGMPTNPSPQPPPR